MKRGRCPIRQECAFCHGWKHYSRDEFEFVNTNVCMNWLLRNKCTSCPDDSNHYLIGNVNQTHNPFPSEKISVGEKIRLMTNSRNLEVVKHLALVPLKSVIAAYAELVPLPLATLCQGILSHDMQTPQDVLAFTKHILFVGKQVLLLICEYLAIKPSMDFIECIKIFKKYLLESDQCVYEANTRPIYHLYLSLMYGKISVSVPMIYEGLKSLEFMIQLYLTREFQFHRMA
jgi:hypothetical protein